MDSDKDNDDPKLSGLGVALVREVQVQQDNRKIESNSACLSFKTRLYMICKTSLVSAVVAQPGRALDLLRGEAEDRAVVSSNLTDGIYICFAAFMTILAVFSIIIPEEARWFLASNITANSSFDK